MGSSDDAVAADALGVASSGVGFHAHPSPPCAGEALSVSHTCSKDAVSAERRHVARSFYESTDDRLVRRDPFDSFFGVLVQC